MFTVPLNVILATVAKIDRSDIPIAQIDSYLKGPYPYGLKFKDDGSDVRHIIWAEQASMSGTIESSFGSMVEPLIARGEYTSAVLRTTNEEGDHDTSVWQWLLVKFQTDMGWIVCAIGEIKEAAPVVTDPKVNIFSVL